MQYSQLLQSYTALATATGMMGMPTMSTATAPPGATSGATPTASTDAIGTITATTASATSTSQTQAATTAVMAQQQQQQQQQQQATYGYPYGYGAAAYGYQAAAAMQQPQTTTSTPGATTMPSPTLFIFHLPPILNEQQLLDLFRPYGNVVDCHIARDAVGGSKGYGFVKYMTTEEAALAITRMNGFQVGGKYLKVDYKK